MSSSSSTAATQTSASTNTSNIDVDLIASSSSSTSNINDQNAAPASSSSASAQTSQSSTKQWQSESHAIQSKTIWPGRGQHILAQFDDDSIVVYQAYNEKIAKYAVEHQKFEGCPTFNPTRMTWVKTNFLWMQFRCGWASKSNQERVLAIWLKRDAFEQYLANARTKGSSKVFGGTVRLQWDPDHLPNGNPHPYRRAVQLGLKGIDGFASGEHILKIEDITEFVHQQGRIADQKDDSALIVARERVFVPTLKEAITALELSPPPTDDNAHE